MEKVYFINKDLSCLSCVKCKPSINDEVRCDKTGKRFNVVTGNEMCSDWKPRKSDVKLWILRKASGLKGSNQADEDL